jgi:hypothetical protein
VAQLLAAAVDDADDRVRTGVDHPVERRQLGTPLDTGAYDVAGAQPHALRGPLDPPVAVLDGGAHHAVQGGRGRRDGLAASGHESTGGEDADDDSAHRTRAGPPVMCHSPHSSSVGGSLPAPKTHPGYCGPVISG